MSDSAILGPMAVVGLNPKPGGGWIAAASACSGYTIIYRRRIEDAPMVRLRFGCSGWDYQEWIGPVYRNATESKLRAYSRIFDTAEINSTFYRVPSPGMVLGWARYTPEDFVFAAKVPQTVTHDRLLDLAKGADKDLLAYCELMRPLLDAGKLGPLILKRPPRLRYQDATNHT